MAGFNHLPKTICKEQVIKVDYMIKRSLRRSKTVKVDNYKSRWFLLCPQAIYYCEGTLESGPGKIKGGIPLSNIAAVETIDSGHIDGKVAVFQIMYYPVTDDDEGTLVLYVKASHNSQRDSWVQQIRTSCLEMGACHQATHFHPAPFQSGRYFCCDNIDRRAEGCEKTSWPQSLSESYSTETIQCLPNLTLREVNTPTEPPFKSTPLPAEPPFKSISSPAEPPFKSTPLPAEPPSPSPHFTTSPEKPRRSTPMSSVPAATPPPNETLEDKMSQARVSNGSSDNFSCKDLPLPELPTALEEKPKLVERKISENSSEEKAAISESDYKVPVPKPRSRKKIFVALFDFEAVESTDLSLKRGEEYEILADTDANWWRAKSLASGNTGEVPANYLTPATADIKKEKENYEELLVKFNWYVGDMDREKAVEILKQENQEGAFLIRNSNQKTDHSYTLSMFSVADNSKRKSNVKHYRIQKDATGKFFITAGHEFNRVSELVMHHKKDSSGLVAKLGSPPVISQKGSTHNAIYYMVAPTTCSRPSAK